ncbi:MAG TPA: 3-dehydroquinate synthase [Candidatus Binataceae bacterium]|nr:3-dehydroquinate synthase [Candidatus Binataceae bacterium]
MESFRLELGRDNHPVHAGLGLLERVGELALTAGLKPSRAAVITDTNVARLFGDRVSRSLSAAGFEPSVIEFPAGEASKSIGVLGTLYDRLVDKRLDRSSTILALGGGVTGDLAGFAAATFLRGIALVQLPTTLTAQVDSALGGKTGINHPAAKNLIGSFYQPRMIVADIAALHSLPDREFREGLGEVIKYGAIMDEPMITELERALPSILRRDPDQLQAIVSRSLSHKADVVRSDEHEGGRRKILNFGHTLGHALEVVAGYGSFLHGEAVGAGMVAAVRLSQAHAGLSEEDGRRLVRLIEAAGLPTAIPSNLRVGDLLEALKLDKKRAGDGVEFVLIDRLGHAFTQKLDFDQVMATLPRA